MRDKRTYQDRAQYIKLAVEKRRKKLRAMAVQYKGGVCQLCGYGKNCHREVHAGITQLPMETLVEKRGELREA